MGGRFAHELILNNRSCVLGRSMHGKSVWLPRRGRYSGSASCLAIFFKVALRSDRISAGGLLWRYQSKIVKITREVGRIGIWGFLIRRSTPFSFSTLTTPRTTKGVTTNNLMRIKRRNRH